MFIPIDMSLICIVVSVVFGRALIGDHICQGNVFGQVIKLDD